MGSTLLIPFENHPQECSLVGRMLLSYGELEFAMMDILAAVLKDSAMAVRTLYQLRSEANRLAVFEAITTRALTEAGLADDFAETICAVNACKAIRNQYAHCHWIANGGLLWFCNLEQTAKTKTADCKVFNRPITLALLEKQMAYFEYADHLLLFIDYEFRLKAGLPTRAEGNLPKPKRIPQPKRDSRGEIRFPQ